jgi:hypothetical protein
MITPQQMLAFVELVEDMRKLQAIYKRTVDSRLRFEVPKLEEQVDAQVLFLRGTLALDVAESEREAAEIEAEREASHMQPDELAAIEAKLGEWQAREEGGAL